MLIFRKAPTIWTMKHLFRTVKENKTVKKFGDDWVPARPLGLSSFRHRTKCAWLAFTGKADVLLWPHGQ